MSNKVTQNIRKCDVTQTFIASKRRHRHRDAKRKQNIKKAENTLLPLIEAELSHFFIDTEKVIDLSNELMEKPFDLSSEEKEKLFNILCIVMKSDDVPLINCIVNLATNQLKDPRLLSIFIESLGRMSAMKNNEIFDQIYSSIDLLCKETNVTTLDTDRIASYFNNHIETEKGAKIDPWILTTTAIFFHHGCALKLNSIENYCLDALESDSINVKVKGIWSRKRLDALKSISGKDEFDPKNLHKIKRLLLSEKFKDELNDDALVFHLLEWNMKAIHYLEYLDGASFLIILQTAKKIYESPVMYEKFSIIAQFIMILNHMSLSEMNHWPQFISLLSNWPHKGKKLNQKLNEKLNSILKTLRYFPDQKDIYNSISLYLKSNNK